MTRAPKRNKAVFASFWAGSQLTEGALEKKNADETSAIARAITRGSNSPAEDVDEAQQEQVKAEGELKSDKN